MTLLVILITKSLQIQAQKSNLLIKSLIWRKSNAIISKCHNFLYTNFIFRALDRLKVANFGRVQLATTMNRVVESIRPHLDAVIIHIGNQELIEAAYSVVSVTENGENMRDSAAIGLSVAGSVATVLSRYFFNQTCNVLFLLGTVFYIGRTVFSYLPI